MFADLGIANNAISGFFGSGIATAIVATWLLRRNKTVEAEVNARFGEALRIFESKRSFKQQSLSDLLGPLVMQFARTKAAFDRWDKRNLYLEGYVVRQGNQTIRDALLSKGHLIPSALIPHATLLIVHYDVWMEKFDRLRGEASSKSDLPYVFAGPDGYPFPKEAEAAFKAEFARLQRDLYGA